MYRFDILTPELWGAQPKLGAGHRPIWSAPADRTLGGWYPTVTYQQWKRWLVGWIINQTGFLPLHISIYWWLHTGEIFCTRTLQKFLLLVVCMDTFESDASRVKYSSNIERRCLHDPRQGCVQMQETESAGSGVINKRKQAGRQAAYPRVSQATFHTCSDLWWISTQREIMRLDVTANSAGFNCSPGCE